MARGKFKIIKTCPEIEAIWASSKHQFPRHSHEEFGIGVMMEGAQKSLSGRGTVEAKAGDIITVNPAEVHDGQPIGEGGRSWKMLFIKPKTIASIMSDITEGQHNISEFHSPVLSDDLVKKRFLCLFKHLTEMPEQDSLRNEGFICAKDEMLILLLQNMFREKSQRINSDLIPNSIDDVQAFIDDEFVQLFSLNDLSKISGLSRFQVLRGFVKKTGLTPHNYMMQRKVHYSKQLILEKKSLVDAALISGFSDQSHMTKMFVKIFGITPGAYAKAVH